MVFKCSSRSSVSEEHIMGPSMFVCRCFPTGVGNLHARDPLLRPVPLLEQTAARQREQLLEHIVARLPKAQKITSDHTV
jgi:hypothetical protein